MIDPMAVMEDPSILVAMEAERDSLKAALSAALAEAERLKSALVHSVETIRKIKPHGHSGDEETGEHDDDCELCACEAALNHAEDAILSGLGPDGRPVGLDMAAKEKAAEETLACQLGGKVKP
jgi:hypothetical protein